MQIFRRTFGMYMPNGTPDKTNSPSPHYAPGELGCSFVDQNTGCAYLRAQLDSGATSATATGAVVANQLAYWKDESQLIVTNDKNQCDAGPSGAINRVAGVFQTAVTSAPGVNGTDGNPVMYLCDLLIRGRSRKVQAASALIGAQATADTSSNVARAVYTTGVNTAPVSQILGIFASSTIDSSNNALVDVAIGFAE